MSTRATYVADPPASLRFRYALAAIVASFCALTHGAQARPLIAWSTDRANPQKLLGGENSHTDIWVMDNLGQGARRLTDDEGDEGGPSWSPDGKRIVFHHSKFEDGFRRRGMSIMDSAGGPWTLLMDDPAGGMPAWSPTGEEIAFGSFRDLKVDIYVVNVDGSNLRNLTRHAANDGDPA